MTNFDFGPYERQENGVKARADGAGDGWSNAHRKANARWYMTDLDALFGTMVFGVNSGDRMFVEYVPDHVRNAQSVIRKYALVALFDRKATTSSITHSHVSLGLYLHVCRLFRDSGQPQPPRFFYVVGGDDPPWLMRELDIDTGEILGDATIFSTERSEWEEIWKVLGLTQARAAIKQWIERFA